MLRHLWSLIVLFGIVTAIYSFIMGEDFRGRPTSFASVTCEYVANEFVGDEIDMDFMLREIKRIDTLETLFHDQQNYGCLGLAYLDGSPSTYVRLTASNTGSSVINLEMEQAHLEDYDCDLLASEIMMKFASEDVSGLGGVLDLRDIATFPNRPPLHCRGLATFKGGYVGPVVFSYDGTIFSVVP